uniref:Uncharacterized protein n=1 Tax=Hyaloperonospora arabidopsidis (strain Emoy2) TaxID=559515 RepID=M4BHR4_HYAAE
MPTHFVPFGNPHTVSQLQQLVPFRLPEPFSPKIVLPNLRARRAPSLLCILVTGAETASRNLLVSCRVVDTTVQALVPFTDSMSSAMHPVNVTLLASLVGSRSCGSNSVEATALTLRDVVCQLTFWRDKMSRLLMPEEVIELGHWHPLS